MTNFEKVKELLTIEDFDGYNGIPCDIIKRLRKKYCGNIPCKECRKWLAEEYVEPIELTEAERTILQNVDKQYKYIARDKTGNLYMYSEKPTKEDEFWDAPSYYCRLEGFEHLFKFVLWEDEQPYEIAELLKEE